MYFILTWYPCGAVDATILMMKTCLRLCYAPVKILPQGSGGSSFGGFVSLANFVGNEISDLASHLKICVQCTIIQKMQ